MAVTAVKRQTAHPDGISSLISAVHDYARGRILYTFGIAGLAAILEGIGILLLLPIAEMIFIDAGGASTSGITRQILHALQQMGITTQFGQLAAMGVVFLTLMVVRAGVLMRREIVLMELMQGFVDQQRRKLFLMLAEADWPVVKRYKKSELLTAMTSNIGRLAQAMQFLSAGMVTAVLGTVSLGAAFVVSVPLGIMLTVLVCAGILFAALWSKRSLYSGRELTLKQFGAMQETTRFLDGLKVAKAARAENELTQRYASHIRKVRETQVAFIRSQSKLRHGLYLAASIVALTLLLAGIGLIGLSPGELLVMVVIIARLAPSFIATASGMQTIAHALPAFQAIRALERSLAAAHQQTGTPDPEDMLVAPSDLSSDFSANLSGAALALRDIAVQITNVNEQTVTLVRASDIVINAGSLVHIGGPSGAGKSSLVELIAGLHLPAFGQAVCGPITLSPQTRRIWQSHVSFMPQEPFIFDGTVRENLCWPDQHADTESLWHALEKAEARKIVEALPLQLDEPLLDGGARLSGGERQRLCLARAFLSDAKLMILDEATSAMDPQLERVIVSRLKNSLKGRITLMVSHSVNAIDLTDKQIHVADGVAALT